MPNYFRHLWFFSITSGSIPICMSKKPPHWNNASLSFVLQIIDNCIHSKITSLWTTSQRQKYNYGDHEINCQRRFPPWDGNFSFSYYKIILFEKKYDIELITLISMYHLKPLVSLDRFIQN